MRLRCAPMSVALQDLEIYIRSQQVEGGYALVARAGRIVQVCRGSSVPWKASAALYRHRCRPSVNRAHAKASCSDY